MHQYHNLNEGTYYVQCGFKNDTAIIECPYVAQRIEVYDAHGLKILHGAQVYWTEVRRQYLPKRKGNREVISAVVVGIKHCEYLCEGKKILCTLRIKRDGENYSVQGVPVDKKLPIFDVVEWECPEGLDMSSSQAIAEYEKRYYWARFLYWNYQESSPKGCILSTFSHAYKTPQIEGEVLMHCLDISQKPTTLLQSKPFNRGKDYLPVRGHRQFRQMVITIDPPGSIDMEDGLSLRSISNGRYELGVHIADVTSYKHLINRMEVATKGTSVYLPHKTIHLLPAELVDQLAFKPKKKRLSFSAFFQIDILGTVYSSKFQKTIIRNSAQLTYEEAQDIIDSEIDQKEIIKAKGLSEDQMEELREKLDLLKTIAFNRRQQRSNSDLFDKSQVVFQLDSLGMPTDIGLKKRIDSERLVEQFMILTNCEVAKRLVDDFGTSALLIHHPRPLDSNLQHLNGCISQMGVKFKADNLQHLSKEFRELFEKEEIGDGLKQLLLLKAVQIQELAFYTRHMSTYQGHFGLSLDYYTHFTSPMRRFADFMVHEQLEKCITGQQLRAVEVTQLEQQISLVNRARIRGKRLKQCVVECFINLFLYSQQSKIRTKGFIIKLGLRSATIFLPTYNLIKEVGWKGSAAYLDKDRVEVSFSNLEGQILKEFQKNDEVEIEMGWQTHQQVQISFILTHLGKEVRC